MKSRPPAERYKKNGDPRVAALRFVCPKAEFSAQATRFFCCCFCCAALACSAA